MNFIGKSTLFSKRKIQKENKFKDMFQKNISQILALCLGVFVLSFLIGLAVLAWTEPGAPPPEGNVPAPINVSDNFQQKTGSLRLGGLTVDYGTSLARLGGSVGIGGLSTMGVRLNVRGGVPVPKDEAPITFQTMDSKGHVKFVIYDSGNVGIGAVAVKEKNRLTVRGGVNIGDIEHNKKAAPSYGMIIQGNVGIGTTYPGQKLDVAGYVKGTGLCIGNDCRTSWPGGTGGIGGSGTKNYLAKFTGASTIGNSQIFDNGTNVGIGTTSPGGKLTVRSTAAANVVEFFPYSSPNWKVYIDNYANLYINKPLEILASYIGADNGALALTAGGKGSANTKVFINTDGNVGIGTTGPEARLHVFGTIDNLFRLERKDAGNPITFKAGTDSALVVNVGGYNRLKIQSDGNVGIGTTSPTQKLDVRGNTYISGNVGIGTAAPAIRLAIGDTDTGLHWISDGNLAVYTNNVERIRINSSGNVGIGTTSPGTKLEVSGQVKITGGSPGDGKVLTSNASGLAWWQYFSFNVVVKQLDPFPSGKNGTYDLLCDTNQTRIGCSGGALGPRGWIRHTIRPITNGCQIQWLSDSEDTVGELYTFCVKKD